MSARAHDRRRYTEFARRSQGGALEATTWARRLAALHPGPSTSVMVRARRGPSPRAEPDRGAKTKEVRSRACIARRNALRGRFFLFGGGLPPAPIALLSVV